MFTIASSLCRMGVEPLNIKNRNTWTRLLFHLLCRRFCKNHCILTVTIGEFQH